jgi:hypothetical protein
MNAAPTSTLASTASAASNILGAIGVDYFFSIVLADCYLILGFYYIAHRQCFPLVYSSIISNTTAASFFILIINSIFHLVWSG